MKNHQITIYDKLSFRQQGLRGKGQELVWQEAWGAAFCWRITNLSSIHQPKWGIDSHSWLRAAGQEVEWCHSVPDIRVWSVRKCKAQDAEDQAESWLQYRALPSTETSSYNWAHGRTCENWSKRRWEPGSWSWTQTRWWIYINHHDVLD